MEKTLTENGEIACGFSDLQSLLMEEVTLFWGDNGCRF
jgi:hypothetical protein